MRVLIPSLVLLLAGASQEPSVTLTFLPSGATAKLGGYRPQRLAMSPATPASITKLPDGLEAPLFGVLTTGLEGTERRFHVVVDEPEGKPARLWVDANGNGDLTDDPAADWAGKEQPGRDGKVYTLHQGGASVALFGDSTQARVAMYRFDKDDPARAELKSVLLYYPDYACEGRMTLGGKTYPVMLADDGALGDFRGKEIREVPGRDGSPAKSASGIRLLVDVNGNGKFDSRGEDYDVRLPFNLAGTTWEIAGMEPSGAKFELVKSKQTVAEIAPPPDHSVGKKITPFTTVDTEGKAVRFPEDYKGKVVLLDFWATWCGPCMVEVPNLVAVYEKLHPRGMEVLGISLDRENELEKVKSVTAQHKMTWRQVYDGKFWQAEIAALYVVQSIPAVYLVDGDTGMILADSKTLRGEQLGTTVEQALARKQKP